MQKLNIPRCACRGPRGTGSGEGPLPPGGGAPTGRRRRTRKGTRIEHSRPVRGTRSKSYEVRLRYREVNYELDAKRPPDFSHPHS